jgi:hypothetical protein
MHATGRLDVGLALKNVSSKGTTVASIVTKPQAFVPYCDWAGGPIFPS